MSQHLQRFAVRMLYDPGLVDQIYAGQVPAGLLPAQAELLRAAPRAAWDTDPYRQSRTLHALLEEFPASAALCGIATLHAFFQDARFHRAIMEREHLALAFGEWLHPQAGSVAVLEQAIAQLRRQTPPTDALAHGAYVTPPHLLPVRLAAGTVDAYQQLRQALGADPLAILADAGFQPLPRPRPRSRPDGDEEDDEHWLLERDASGSVELGGGSAGLCGLLEAALVPVPVAHLIQVACRLGAEDEEEAAGILAELVADGLLLRGGVDGAR